MKNSKKVIIKGFTYILLKIYCNEKDLTEAEVVDELLYKSLKKELLEINHMSDKNIGILIDNIGKR